MPDGAGLLLHGVLGAFVMFNVLWVIQCVRRDAGVVDVGWTAGVGLMALYLAWRGDGWAPRRVLTGLLGAAWSARLVFYILVNRVLPPHEDGRYARMRAYWGKRANMHFYWFFTTQALLVGLFAIPFLAPAAIAAPHWRVWDGLGLLVWLVAVGGETLADRQLARFRADPANRGKTCRAGLWRYSRHPNYFFEWVHWWAYVVLAAGGAGWAWTLVGPVVMYAFLRWLTGIPYTEKQALSSRGEDYRAYQRTTNMLFPWPPRAA
jgi:steroid 5-alpha reductase family enzyme